MFSNASRSLSKKALTFAGIAAVATLGLSGCAAPEAEDDGISILLSLSTLDNPYFIDLSEGAQAAADDAGVTLEVVDAQNDAATQANQLADAITQGFDLVIINSVDSDAVAPSAEALIAAGIPVIAVDNAVNGVDDVSTTVASDNVFGGEIAAEALGEALGGSGEIAILRGLSGDSSSVKRFDGFTAGIAEFAGITVVSTQTADYDRAKGLDVTTNIMQANPGIVGIFAENDEMALGAIEALGDKAGTSVFVVGFDGTADGIAAIDAGTLYASVAQQAYLLGQTSVEKAVALLGGASIDPQTQVEVTLLVKQ